MKFDFGPNKCAANLAKDGFDLRDGLALNLDEAVVLMDERVDYHATRYRACGLNAPASHLRLSLLNPIHELNFHRIPRWRHWCCHPPSC